MKKGVSTKEFNIEKILEEDDGLFVFTHPKLDGFLGFFKKGDGSFEAEVQYEDFYDSDIEDEFEMEMAAEDNAQSLVDELRKKIKGSNYELSSLSSSTGMDLELHDKTQKNKKENKMKTGGNLKPIPAGNKGLPNLPEEVRNKMGYMKKGGKTKAPKRSAYSIELDSEIKAKKPGRRVSESGNVYYESRPEHSDENRKKKPYLEQGGQMAKGGGVKGSDKKLYWYEYYPHMSGTYKAEAVITEKTLHQLKKLMDADEDEEWEELLNASVKGKKFYFADEIFTQHWSKLIKALKSNKAFGDMTEEGSFAISPNNIKEAKKIVRDIEAEQLDLDDDDYAKGGQMANGGKAKGYKGYKSQFAMEQDAAIKAKKPGKRVSASGNVYYESRPNHADENRKKKPYLEMGGKMEMGGEATESKWVYKIGGLNL